MATGLFLTGKVKIYSIHKIHWMGQFFHGACAILKEQHFRERLCEIIFVMGQWFRISCCLKIYFVLVLVAGYTVQQSISVSNCSILVSMEL